MLRTSVLFLALFLAAGSGYAQIMDPDADVPGHVQMKQPEEKKQYLYEWKDSKGGYHITDSLGKVPEKYRSRARKIESSIGEEPVLAPYSGGAEQDAIEADQRDYWYQRMRSAKQRLADAEERYRSLAQERDKALEMWGGPGAAAASGHFEGRAEAERITEEMKQVQQQIDDARNEINVVIPDDARKAGVPPGWIRE